MSSPLHPFRFRRNSHNMAQPPTEGSSSRAFGTSFRSQLGASWGASNPLAEAAIAIDAEDEDSTPNSSEDEFEDEDGNVMRAPASHAMNQAYRRPSFVAAGPRSAVVSGSLLPEGFKLSKKERERMTEEERSLLRDNELLPPKHPKRLQSEDNLGARIGRHLSLGSTGLRKTKSQPDEESGIPSGSAASERTGLLSGQDPGMPYGGEASPTNINKKWEEAIQAGKIQTTWQREAKVLAKYSRSLILTFILQYSLTMASIFTVGHIGKVELGAVSLASSMFTRTMC